MSESEHSDASSSADRPQYDQAKFSALAEVSIVYAVNQAKRYGNPTPLISLLRSTVRLTPDVRHLLADVLEGKVRLRRPVEKWRPTSQMVRSRIAWLTLVLRGDKGTEAWELVAPFLDELGLGVPDRKGEITRAARAITAETYKLTPAQLDEILSPRSARRKDRR